MERNNWKFRISLWLSFINFLIIVIWFPLSPYANPPFSDPELSYDFKSVYFPVGMAVLATLFFLIDKITKKKYEWKYLIILLLSILSYVAANLIYCNLLRDR